ncbi:MAG: hypothetical protein HRT61_01645 [Ekhidna sp.]|nr:hypothetical protein [Ekhidna sp.]
MKYILSDMQFDINRDKEEKEQIEKEKPDHSQLEKETKPGFPDEVDFNRFLGCGG